MDEWAWGSRISRRFHIFKPTQDIFDALHARIGA